ERSVCGGPAEIPRRGRRCVSVCGARVGVPSLCSSSVVASATAPGRAASDFEVELVVLESGAASVALTLRPLPILGTEIRLLFGRVRARGAGSARRSRARGAARGELTPARAPATFPREPRPKEAFDPCHRRFLERALP